MMCIQCKMSLMSKQIVKGPSMCCVEFRCDIKDFEGIPLCPFSDEEIEQKQPQNLKKAQEGDMISTFFSRDNHAELVKKERN